MGVLLNLESSACPEDTTEIIAVDCWSPLHARSSFQLTGSLKVIVTQLALANGMGTATVSEPSRQRSDGGGGA